MLYKDRLEDLVSHYLSKTYSFAEVKKMLGSYGTKAKQEREKNIDAVVHAIKMLIDQDARRRELAKVELDLKKEGEEQCNT